MPRRLAQKLILSLTVIVVVIAGISGLISVKSHERQLLDAMILGADQLSNSITSATWHAMLADHRTDAYQVMETIAEKQGIEQIRMFNREGHLTFSTRPGEVAQRLDKTSSVCSLCHSTLEPKVKLTINSRARIVTEDDGRRNLTMITPIYNEPSCSEAACHAHPQNIRVLGVLDVALKLDQVDAQIADAEVRVAGTTLIEILLLSVLIFFFTRHFVSVPIQQLIEGTRAVSAMELDRPIVVRPSSLEVDELAQSFDDMRERLRHAMGEINQFTQSLESKVQARTEELRAAHHKLLQADRLASLGQMAASVAHEINNPIAGVLNLSMLMQRILKDDGIPQQRIPEFRKYLGQVVGETSRAGRIVSDLLAFSRRSKPQRTNGDLNKIIETTLSLVNHKLRLSNVEVETELAADLPQVPCDGSQMQQVVLNLILNAAEASHGRAGSKVKIVTRIAGERAVLQVSDNGEGIPAENLTKIFDPFFTTKPEGKGVGLGLAVLYGIVQSHGGEVEVNSRVGEGATFTVSLPLVQAETAAVAGRSA